MVLNHTTATLAATMLVASALMACAPAQAETALTETGSTLILPLFKTWAADYAASHPGVTIATAGTGSAKGIAEAVSGTVNIGTSDAYMSDDDALAHPEIVDVPMAISALTINYNLPDVTGSLKLDGPTLAAIYAGVVRFWDDKAIASLNPGVSLPHHEIVPVHRAEGSGDTFVFTQYLSFTTAGRDEDTSTVIRLPGAAWGDQTGFGTSVAWPKVPGDRDATGNDGMVATIAASPYSIGYVGVSFEKQIEAAKLGTASVKSFAGQFLLPTPETIEAAADALTPRTPDDERLTLVNAPGQNCYPLINYEYAIVSTKQKDKATAAAIRNFLLWAIAPDEANKKTLDDQHFVELPAHVWVKSHDQIAAIE
ncbi:phosphate ABC transporter substrate-binding protein PstS [Lichenihabitans psoromatis]|uniref:phosphate ABC transporter substrate-binding protein PstS n=1 Tax=Lichenihabitans psoromatis TaxID=2528642 RepID=UPI0013F167C6|nr:phosphate ABC transporter substrate-binding protein PstS [Lichenihabitans psoromatis]